MESLYGMEYKAYIDHAGAWGTQVALGETPRERGSQRCGPRDLIPRDTSLPSDLRNPTDGKLCPKMELPEGDDGEFSEKKVGPDGTLVDALTPEQVCGSIRSEMKGHDTH